MSKINHHNQLDPTTHDVYLNGQPINMANNTLSADRESKYKKWRIPAIIAGVALTAAAVFVPHTHDDNAPRQNKIGQTITGDHNRPNSAPAYQDQLHNHNNRPPVRVTQAPSDIPTRHPMEPHSAPSDIPTRRPVGPHSAPETANVIPPNNPDHISAGTVILSTPVIRTPHESPSTDTSNSDDTH